MHSDSRILIGLMSGTSADGVDAAAVRVTGRGRAMSAELLQHTHVPYADALQKRIFALRGAGHGSFAEYATVCRDLTLVHAQAVNACMASAELKPDDVAALAVHGQTFFHEPPNTIQLFDPALLAWETNCRVISDFRRADMAAGGQGAPLVPFADWLLFRHPTKHRVLLNLGGIANLTYLPAGCELEDVIAFDCGPANCLSDHIMRTRGNAAFDEGGIRAFEGTAADISSYIEFEPFFTADIPKSTDPPSLIDSYERWRSTRLQILGLTDLNHELASVADIAEEGIYWALMKLSTIDQHDIELVVSGGGLKNRRLRDNVRSAFYRCRAGLEDDLDLGRWSVVEMQDFGVQADAKEAVAFALLGAATLDGEPSNVPSATGASRGVVLGSITPRP